MDALVDVLEPLSVTSASAAEPREPSVMPPQTYIPVNYEFQRDYGSTFQCCIIA
ncbi:hypothetical protein IEO21_09443 [Rhodonia placenta]|uniref:Pheromone n=1 Tax=Rhodonia placenta TaxID=104341 RepID=A0A8H7NUS1_9APHY|nr:hypothetical protein IEO21_09443 [Postia placenta]